MSEQFRKWTVEELRQRVMVTIGNMQDLSRTLMKVAYFGLECKVEHRQLMMEMLVEYQERVDAIENELDRRARIKAVQQMVEVAEKYYALNNKR